MNGMKPLMAERLLVRPLPDNELLLHFNLSVTTGRGDLRDLGHFPRPVAELVLGTGALHASLTLRSGRWLSRAWGALPVPMPAGGELSAAFPTDGWPFGWHALRRSLGLLVCATPATADEFSRPDDPFASHLSGALPPSMGGRGGHSRGPNATLEFRAVLPPQGVCTENLARWLQLWPCGGAAGITTLLSPAAPSAARRLRHARFRALRLELRQHAAPPRHSSHAGGTRARGRWSLLLSLSLVLPADASRPPPHGRADDLLGGLLSRGLRACELASSSSLALELPTAAAAALGVAAAAAQPYGAARLTGGAEGAGGVLEWALRPNQTQPLLLGWRGEPHAMTHPSPMEVRRVAAREDDTRGELVLQLRNRAPDAASVAVFEEMPRWLVPRWHSLQAFVDGRPIATSAALLRLKVTSSEHGGQLVEWAAVLPANSSLILALGYHIGLLAVDRLAADASRGLELCSPTISFSYGGDLAKKIYAEPLLIPLLLPDTSMPYNVISISSTMVALFVGSMFNLLSRRRVGSV
ncbi:hypothetical protein AB1Y20_010100 [Prymnesium parvum]|uniref:GPI transamidase component PIG-T n=1 Tax=Prymnesium parvum TaxID=97485 RepID=A0AB34K5U9_PRYPA